MRRVQVEKKRSTERRPPRPGDLFLFPKATRAAVRWAVLMTHPDNAHLYFVIPGDDKPLAGTADIAVPASAASGAMTLRCGFGLWIAEGYFDPKRRAGFLEEKYIRLARNKLSQLVACRTEGTPQQCAAEEDPKYAAWLQLIEKARAAVERWLSRQGLMVVQDEFQRDPPESLRALLASAEYRARTKSSPASERPQWLRIPSNLLGELFLQTQPDGVRALWVGSKERPPPLRGRGPKGKLVPARWRQAKGGFLAEPVFPWRANGAVLIIGPRKGFKVIVRPESAQA